MPCAEFKVNCDPDGRIANIRCFALDMDGTFYIGNDLLEGSTGFLKRLEETGRSYVFLTNNSSKSGRDYVKKLSDMGLDIESDKIVTSGQVMIDYIKRNFAEKKVFLLGNSTLAAEFEESGIETVYNGAQLVVTAFDTTLDYEKMRMVCDYVRAGLPYIATHPDFNCPTESGFIPDIGAIHAFIHASTGRNPDKIVGKPNREIIDYALRQTGFTAAQTAIVGDRLYTDVAAGLRHGLTGVLVLSGETKLENLAASEVQPHLIFDSLARITPFL